MDVHANVDKRSNVLRRLHFVFCGDISSCQQQCLQQQNFGTENAVVERFLTPKLGDERIMHKSQSNFERQLQKSFCLLPSRTNASSGEEM